MSSTDTAPIGTEAPRRARTTTVASLSALVGAHPGALRKIFSASPCASPAELGPSTEGRLLAIEPLRDLFLLTRPLARALGSSTTAWQGKVFEPDGAAGWNVFYGGRRALGFRVETAPSLLDGAPAMVLTYDDPALGNPRLLRGLRGEARLVGDGIAMGPLFVPGPRGAKHVAAWWGIQGSR
jgi:hypothetical protein